MATKNFITPKETLNLLLTHKENKKLRLHTIEVIGSVFMGCNMDLKELKILLNTRGKNQIVLSGDSMLNMGHGVGIQQDNGRWRFLETDIDKISSFKFDRGLV